jgi:hypothetical protein
MKEVIQKQYDVALETILAILTVRYGLRSFQKMVAGHMGVPLFSCENAQGKKLVVKIGFEEQSKLEVVANSIGYQEIAKITNDKLLPSYLVSTRVIDTPVLIMSHLGESLSERARKGDTSLFTIARDDLERVFLETISTDESVHQAGLEEVKKQLSGWWEKLIAAGIIETDSRDDLERIDVAGMSSPASALMILDFTPDNLFLAEKSVSFIDPWLQASYRGTPLPSIGQFMTLAKYIYDLPGAKENYQQFVEMAYRVGGAMELSDGQATKQLYLGGALQYALSAYVRIEANPVLATEFAQMSRAYIQQIFVNQSRH